MSSAQEQETKMFVAVCNRQYPGFVAFTSVLVVAAVLFVVTSSLGLLTVMGLQTAFSWKQGAAVTAFAQACSEDALLRLRRSVSYTGSSLTEGNISCTSVVSGSGANRTILVTSTLTGPPNYVKQYQLTVKRAGGSVTVSAIQEL